MDTDRLLIAPYRSRRRRCLPGDHPTLTRFMAFEPEASPEDFANVWQGWLPLMREGEEVIFVARRREDRQFVGVGGAHNLRSRTPELGIWVKESLHGRLRARNRAGHRALGQRALSASAPYLPGGRANTASRRLAESLGGVLAGKRENIKYDAVVYHLPPQH
ncbi:GNAT family N-acetyltransferase [Serratia ureilytica]